MAVLVSILAIIISLHLIALVLAICAERRRSKAVVVTDENYKDTYCVYELEVLTVYRLTVFRLLVISQLVVNVVTRCLCSGKANWTIFFFILSWISSLGAEACVLARGIFGEMDLTCATLRKGIFAGGAALTLFSLLGSILYYWAHSRADIGGFEKYENEGVAMTTSSFQQQQQQ